MKSNKELIKIANKVRKEILMMAYKSEMGHVGSAFSVVEILIFLYFRIMQLQPLKPKFSGRDRFILSKGHAASALYAVLKEKGILSKSQLDQYCRDRGSLEVHPSHHVNGIEISTGSLGDGLTIGVGMAMAVKLKKRSEKVYVLLSDAECDEGETWAAILSAAHYKLDNLTVFLDYNKVQALGRKKDILDIEPLRKKFEAFGWTVSEADGHDFYSLQNAYHLTIKSRGPKILIF